MKTKLFHCNKWKYKKHYPFEKTSIVNNIFITKSVSRLWAWSTPHSRAILCVSQERQLVFSPARTLEMILLFSQHTLFLHNSEPVHHHLDYLLQLVPALPLLFNRGEQPWYPFPASPLLFSLYPLILHILRFKEPWIFPLCVWTHK